MMLEQARRGSIFRVMHPIRPPKSVLTVNEATRVDAISATAWPRRSVEDFRLAALFVRPPAAENENDRRQTAKKFSRPTTKALRRRVFDFDNGFLELATGPRPGPQEWQIYQALAIPEHAAAPPSKARKDIRSTGPTASSKRRPEPTCSANLVAKRSRGWRGSNVSRSVLARTDLPRRTRLMGICPVRRWTKDGDHRFVSPGYDRSSIFRLPEQGKFALIALLDPPSQWMSLGNPSVCRIPQSSESRPGPHAMMPSAMAAQVT
jgi:hypothetical protein